MSHNELNGMTVNERLFYLNLMDEFESSINEKNMELAVEILQKAKFSNEQAFETVTTILNNPKKYGYR
jgi:thymidine phosphorylase